MTHDEVFVTAKAAKEGILIKNLSPTDDLVCSSISAQKPKDVNMGKSSRLDASSIWAGSRPFWQTGK